MANNRKYTQEFSNRALEMIMRDVLSSMEEYTLETAYENNTEEAGFEILDIHPPRQPIEASSAKEAGATSSDNAEVLHFPDKKLACG